MCPTEVITEDKDIVWASGETLEQRIMARCRVTTYANKPIGVEMDDAVSSIDDIIYAMPENMKKYINPVTLNDSVNFTKRFFNSNIDSGHINLLGIIFKSVIDPRSLQFISLESTINLLAVGFTYLWGMGHKSLALLLASQPADNISDVHSFNSTSNFTRVPQELKDKLTELYPYQRPQNDKTNVNLVEEWISLYTTNLNKKIWVPIPDEHYIKEVLGDNNYSLIIPSDIKVKLAEFIIQHEVNSNAQCLQS